MPDPGTSFGFAAPARDQTFSRRRTAVELAATLGLTACLIVAATAVTLGNRSLMRQDAISPTPTPLGDMLDDASDWLAFRAQSTITP